MNGRPVSIEVRDVHKVFHFPAERRTTLKERATHPRGWLRPESKELTALSGVSFDVHRGEFFGIIGRNGCGKSTLLKLMASIYGIDSGSIRVAGRLAPFIELGVGFNPELTARDNVVLNGVMMGLSPSEARSRFDAVIDYAELHDYTALKLKNYSSGMQVRLAFALMLQVDADVLLIDEVLAVGDVAFQEKCARSLRELHGSGITIVLVSHDMGSIEDYCERVLLIEDGKSQFVGEAKAATHRYVELMLGADGDAAELTGLERPAQVTQGWLDGVAEESSVVKPGTPIVLKFKIEATDAVEDLSLAVDLIRSRDGIRVGALSVGPDELGLLKAGQALTASVELQAALAPGRYRFNWALSRKSGEREQVIDRCAVPITLEIDGAESSSVLSWVDHEVLVERGTGVES